MDDNKLRILVLTKLYQINRKHEDAKNLKDDPLIKNVDEAQLNFCYQYLGTLNLINFSYTNHESVYFFSATVYHG